MSKIYTVIIEKDQYEGYVASVPGLPGCYSQGDTMEETLENIKDAITLYLEDLKESNKDLYIPEIVSAAQVSFA